MSSAPVAFLFWGVILPAAYQLPPTESLLPLIGKRHIPASELQLMGKLADPQLYDPYTNPNCTELLFLKSVSSGDRAIYWAPTLLQAALGEVLPVEPEHFEYWPPDQIQQRLDLVRTEWGIRKEQGWHLLVGLPTRWGRFLFSRGIRSGCHTEHKTPLKGKRHGPSTLVASAT